RRDRLGPVAREDRNSHSLRPEELDRLACVGAQALAQHREPERLLDHRSRVGADRAASDSEGDDAAAGTRGLLGDRPALARRNAPTWSRASVSVPVLSSRIVSTEASDSIAFSCCARTPRRAIRIAATA